LCILLPRPPLLLWWLLLLLLLLLLLRLWFLLMPGWRLHIIIGGWHTLKHYSQWLMSWYLLLLLPQASNCVDQTRLPLAGQLLCPGSCCWAAHLAPGVGHSCCCCAAHSGSPGLQLLGTRCQRC
jgi:hypothetical protein